MLTNCIQICKQPLSNHLRTNIVYNASKLSLTKLNQLYSYEAC